MKHRQIDLSDNELQKLSSHIWQDFLGAISNHDARNERFIRYYRMWRGLNESPVSDDTGEQLQVPMLKWTTFSHWSRVVGALLGDDAEIVAKPNAPLDAAIVTKVGRYMTWRLFEYMKAVSALGAWTFRSVLFGRAHAYVPYDQDYYWERQPDGSDKEKLIYDGPKIIPLWPSEIILPAQDGVNSVSEFSFKIRRVRMTPQELLDGERRGEYFGIEENWDLIYGNAQQRQERDYWWDNEKISKDEAEGVNYSNVMGNRNSVEVWQWYGKWRLPKGNRDARPGNLKRREPIESDLLVTMLPKVTNRIIGVEDLRDLYPRQAKRDPFVDIGLVKDGSYWCPGVGEMVEDMQRKSTANYALFETAGKFSVGPVIFYKPSAGSFDPDTFVYKPMTSIPTEDPSTVQVVRFDSNFEFTEKNQQQLQSFVEKVTGDTDSSQGVSTDRPNAPRTASGQMLLAQGANTRIGLDMTFLREDLSQFLEYVWSLDREYASPQVFFRVTEEDAEGLYDVNNGFGTMTAEEREHSFDFQLKFANNIYSKEANKERAVQLYGLAVANPIVQQNPRALWSLLDRVWKAVSPGGASFSDIMPAPPKLDEPLDPKTEWAMALKGEDIVVNPMDDDKAHLIDHRKRLEQEMLEDDPQRRDPQAEAMMAQHIHEHEGQLRAKMVVQQLMQSVDAMAGQQPGQPGGQSPGPAAPQGPPQAPAPAVNGAVPQLGPAEGAAPAAAGGVLPF